MQSLKVEILNTTKGKLPSLPFDNLKKEILGESYELSVAFVGEKKSKELNNSFRQKNKPTNILSFSLSKNSGEIVLCPKVIKKEYKKFNKNFKEFLCFLVIHGMLHLKGMEHGCIMEEEEERYFSKFKSSLIK